MKNFITRWSVSPFPSIQAEAIDNKISQHFVASDIVVLVGHLKMELVK
jgi:hypothetical protein